MLRPICIIAHSSDQEPAYPKVSMCRLTPAKWAPINVLFFIFPISQLLTFP